MFEQVKNEILAVGFDEILAIPKTTDKRIELAVLLLNDAGVLVSDNHNVKLIKFQVLMLTGVPLRLHLQM